MNKVCFKLSSGKTYDIFIIVLLRDSSQMGECMLDEPQEHSYPIDDMAAGAFYSAAEQCVFIFGPSRTHYNQGGVSSRGT